MAKHDVVVVGSGLFGSIAATLARAEGHRVSVVSDERPFSASKASGCVLAPTWLNSMDKYTVAEAMEVLNSLYTVIPVEFFSNVFAKTFKASRIDPKQILVKPDVRGTVTAVGDGFVNVQDISGADRKLRGKVLLATGVWTPDLAPGMPKMKGLWGAAARISAQLEEPRIHVYAPYRQAVAFNIDKKTVWMGDGTALIEKTWFSEVEERLKATANRAAELFGLPTEDSGQYRMTIGVRPYVEGHKAGYFDQAGKNVWISTGGAKNGTALAAWQALRFVRQLGALR